MDRNSRGLGFRIQKGRVLFATVQVNQRLAAGFASKLTPGSTNTGNLEAKMSSTRRILPAVASAFAMFAATRHAAAQPTKNTNPPEASQYRGIVGEIRIFAFDNITDLEKRGWLECNGKSLLKTEYRDLWRAIGSAWGSKDEYQFNIPDLRAMFLRGWSHDRTGNFIDPDASNRTASPGGKNGNNVGSLQNAAVERHAHPIYAGRVNATFPTWQNSGDKIGYAYGGDSSNPNTESYGGSETRPSNAYVMYAIFTGKIS